MKFRILFQPDPPVLEVLSRRLFSLGFVQKLYQLPGRLFMCRTWDMGGVKQHGNTRFLSKDGVINLPRRPDDGRSVDYAAPTEGTDRCSPSARRLPRVEIQATLAIGK
jgi:hypothetical protein